MSEEEEDLDKETVGRQVSQIRKIERQKDKDNKCKSRVNSEFWPVRGRLLGTYSSRDQLYSVGWIMGENSLKVDLVWENMEIFFSGLQWFAVLSKVL